MSLQPFTIVTGAAPYLRHTNMDTDVIIRIERLTSLGRDQLGPYALEALRYLPDGSEDPAFILNQEQFRGAPFILAGENFGCGSSREGAVWALQGIGIRCIIAPSFGDIFYSNCFQNGVLPIRLSLQHIETLAAACQDGVPLTVDLEQCILHVSGASSIRFEVDVLRREGLLHGLDDIGLTLKHNAEIVAWQHKDRLRRPWAWNTVARTDTLPP
ncbi:3-isopropylmalate dehydratase small subunit [Advenella mimigardefordensis DPN7]|uniref:3-isopropylmalate dehydratase n=1 Tax=Advenella mimigardefordensis (strain DSM 17166 / LMG 22922 / DPN7) TaxID=1247726 RepID=W0PAU5_ADVMD|nr:3-isopropylmalate dehydratase small subunit [Advenella mimigardefordensis]AHG62540.1 3-isopropylmalate dehydratase small subunit [Advenella mimigardefordensis DPN7]